MSVEVLPTKNVDLETAQQWHTLSVAQTFEKLRSSARGLTAAEAERRLTEYGPNQLQAAARISPWMILLEQVKNVLIIILLLATALSAFLGHGVEAIAITVIVLFAVILGFVQEYRAERAIEALIDLGELERTDRGRYRVIDPLFVRWLSRQSERGSLTAVTA